MMGKGIGERIARICQIFIFTLNYFWINLSFNLQASCLRQNSLYFTKPSAWFQDFHVNGQTWNKAPCSDWQFDRSFDKLEINYMNIKNIPLSADWYTNYIFVFYEWETAKTEGKVTSPTSWEVHWEHCMLHQTVWKFELKAFRKRNRHLSK